MFDPTPFLVFLGLLMEAQRGGGGQAGPPGPPAVAPSPDTPASPATPSTPSTPATPALPGLRLPPLVQPAPAVPPGTSPPMPPWPAPPTPGTLPPFPGPGWCPDSPVTPAVSARAAYWNALLWNFATKSIAKPFVQEMLGGQWVTFAAAWHPGDSGAHTFMATEAWRVCTAPPVAPSSSSPAQAMNDALTARGYKQSDQPLYIAFQQSAALKPDGFPGTHTMGALASALSAQGLTIAPVPVYPWLTKPGTSGYDGVNAPTWAEWMGTGPQTVPAVSPAPGVTNAQPASNLPPAQAAAVAMNDALVANGYRKSDQGVYAAFQTAAGLGHDGFPGSHTMNALAQILHDAGVTMAPVQVYPWLTKPGTSGYDGVNAPTLAEWAR